VVSTPRSTRHLEHRLSDSPFKRLCPMNTGLTARARLIRADPIWPEAKRLRLHPPFAAMHCSKRKDTVTFASRSSK
jgi:hypothetical protein